MALCCQDAQEVMDAIIQESASEELSLIPYDVADSTANESLQGANPCREAKRRKLDQNIKQDGIDKMYYRAAGSTIWHPLWTAAKYPLAIHELAYESNRMDYEGVCKYPLRQSSLSQSVGKREREHYERSHKSYYGASTSSADREIRLQRYVQIKSSIMDKLNVQHQSYASSRSSFGQRLLEEQEGNARAMEQTRMALEDQRAFMQRAEKQTTKQLHEMQEQMDTLKRLCNVMIEAKEKEQHGEKASVFVDCVIHSGYKYTALDMLGMVEGSESDYDDLTPAGGMRQWRTIPTGWELAPDTEEIRENVVAAHKWACRRIVLAKGSCVRTSLSTLPGGWKGTGGLRKHRTLDAYRTVHAGSKSEIRHRVLIRTPIVSANDEVYESCAKTYKSMMGCNCEEED